MSDAEIGRFRQILTGRDIFPRQLRCIRLMERPLLLHANAPFWAKKSVSAGFVRWTSTGPNIIMEWSDEALIISVRPHGETAAIIEVFSRDHGRHLGMVHGGRSRLQRPILQIGNHVDVVWKARLADHLGTMKVELRHGYAAQALEDRAGLALLTSMAALIRLIPERDPHENFYEISMFVLGYLDDFSIWPALYVRWEMELLGELGFGLDLTACAATGSRENLIYVSPKSGKAVSASAGEPYKDRLMILPGFLKDGQREPPSAADVLAGLKLTEFFLLSRVYEQHGQGVPEARLRLSELLRRAVSNDNGAV